MARNEKPQKRSRTIVFVTFESEFAPLGGLAAVMKILPKRMATAERGRCFTIAPLFKAITYCKPIVREIHLTGRRCSIQFGTREHHVDILEHVDSSGFRTYLLDSDAFFTAPCDCHNPLNPLLPCNPYRNPSYPRRLLWDALFFCAAVPKALAALGHTKNLILHLQDWETAAVALTVKEDPRFRSVACILTLHNTYDQKITTTELAKIARRHVTGRTILTKTLPMLDGPVCTVSQGFAREVLTDPLHTEVYAPHLHQLLKRQNVLGIDNGLFTPLDFPHEAIEAATSGNEKPILAEKRRRRTALMRVVKTLTSTQAWGTLRLDGFEGPIFLMCGRDDPRQKGYDLAAAAIQNIPKGRAKYIFTPIPGDEGLEGLRFLKRLAHQRPGEVTVLPFRMTEGYRELRQGSSFLVFCSLYEPFGGATEGYAMGTPVIARATGGLGQQVVPYPSPCLSATARRNADAFHAPNATPSGFLFKEDGLSTATVTRGWKHIIRCGYWPSGDRVGDRLGTPLFDEMVRAATRALTDAITLYTTDPATYAKMIASGIALLSHFSWDRAVREYQRVYDRVCR